AALAECGLAFGTVDPQRGAADHGSLRQRHLHARLLLLVAGIAEDHGPLDVAHCRAAIQAAIDPRGCQAHTLDRPAYAVAATILIEEQPRAMAPGQRRRRLLIEGTAGHAIVQRLRLRTSQRPAAGDVRDWLDRVARRLRMTRFQQLLPHTVEPQHV